MGFHLVPKIPASPPLPSGEHPWAARLRLLRKSLSVAELALAVAITFALYNGAAEEWAISTQVRFQSPWARALAYSALLSLVYAVPSLPFSFARHVVGRKYGLSTQTLAHWALDAVKGALLGAVLGSIVVLGLTATLVYGKNGWWWMAAIGAAVFGVVLTRLAPQLIIPVFFKMKPLENAELVERFTSLARKTGTPVLGI
ncbi:MAG: hypothetical protein HY075_16570, partial [Deltaproteobacteria bacterium]|nr:hypothetical protein [Deltaproteobacteria bacterium]